MSSIIPITLIGENLGKRHLYLNSLVIEAYKQNEDFEIIENLPERSTIDRLFKIDIASKMRNISYIIKNLKDDDMLNVSRVLKSTWLIQHDEVINPRYLEDTIYPAMVTTAITKLEHWIHLNLRDEKRCHDFYQHYYEKNFNLAMKFFVKCSTNIIQSEFPKVMHNINPHIFKVLCEKCSNVAKIFFDSLTIDEKLKCQYLDKQSDYLHTLKYLLKTDTDLVLDIYEKYFGKDQCKKFSPAATKYIMTNHKIRFLKKPELYTAYFLRLQTLAESLTSDECKEIVIKLARAKYLTCLNWFSYKKVEPFIKRLKPQERAEFKKKVFVIKDIGEDENEWPYHPPAPPNRECTDNHTIFDDRQFEPEAYNCKRLLRTKRMIKKKRGDKNEYVEIFSECAKTLLDKLYDEYRFVSFGQTLYDLRRRITAESSPQNREYMMLVLVSKSGGRPDAIALLLELLARHSNETPNVRAAIIRSLVKRAQVWRLPEVTWNQLLEFGRDLGLDGNLAVADCNEGLHAVVIRNLLLFGKCESKVQNAFLSKFSYLTDYALSTTEKKSIAELLPKMILNVVNAKEDICDAVHWIDRLIDTLNAYKIKLETYPGFIDTISKFAEKDESHVAHILINLYKSRVARKNLFRFTFNLIKTDASYVNALRHDPTIIDVKLLADYFIDGFMTNPEQFLRKISIYFNEENGLAPRVLEELKCRVINVKILGRPLAILLGSKLESYLYELDATKFQILSASIRANGHIARPLLDIEYFGWTKAGAKLVANKVLKCRSIDIDNYIEKLLKLKITARLGLLLSKRTTYETETFIKLVYIRPKTVLKSGLKLIKSHYDKVDDRIWETIKPIIQEFDVTSDRVEYLVRNLGDIKNVPLKIRPEYSTVIYTLFKKKSVAKAMPPLCHIEKLLPDINEQFIENLLLQYLAEDFVISKLPKERNEIQFSCLYIRILIKFLFLCKNEDSQKSRWVKFGEPFFAQMEEIFKKPCHKQLFAELLSEIFLTLKYSKVFLNSQYVSALPVMENVLIWIQKLFPMEKHFEKYVKLHLSMLYFKSVRQSVTLFPDTFSDERKTRKEGVEIVGNIFGKYIAREVKSLIEKYFGSVTELYAKVLNSYLEEYTNYYISSELLLALLKGILEEGKGRECLVGIHVMKDKYGHLKEEHCKEVKEIFRGITNPEGQLIASAEILA